jgi:hypothetical protein
MVIESALARFRPNHPSAPANTFVFGLVTSDEPLFSIIVSPREARIEAGVREAEYLIYGTSAQLAALFDANQANRAAIVAQVKMRPDYPFNNYLLSILLNALDLSIPDLDYVAKRMMGTFPFPPRYPVAENLFRQRHYEPTPIPAYDRERLPQLVVDNHPEWVAMYDKAWQLAFKNLRQPECDSGFIANFVDPAFNANTYLWDSCFMMQFGRYARRVCDFMGTLDNFYAKQHDDGFICREIDTYSGHDLYQALDPRSTGPNLFAWTEWLHYQHTADVDRLSEVFPVLVGYHRWWKDWRTHPDGSYWTSGWASGMDNQTRVPRSEFHHRHHTWVDATLQQVLNLRILLTMAQTIGRDEFNDELADELEQLTLLINEHLWDEDCGFYFDRAPDGRLSSTKSIGAYWALLNADLPQDRADRLIAHLDDPKMFNRPHRVPTTPHDSPDYNPYGGYWLGAVWSPTNYMVLRGLTEQGKHDLAYAIARNHVENVAAVFRETGTLWENYSAEHPQPGKPAGHDFVGWTGVSAISIPLEYLIGLRTTDVGKTLIWDIRLTERHGVIRYPLGSSNTVDLICEQRNHSDECPRLSITTQSPVTLHVTFAQRVHTFNLVAGEQRLDVI